MKRNEFIKIDSILVCEIVEEKNLEYQPDFYRIKKLIELDIRGIIVLVFHINIDGVDKLIHHSMTVDEKDLVIEENINNFDIFDFIFFGYIVEQENKKNIYKNLSLGELKLGYRNFRTKLATYRSETVRHKTFYVKQRRISRKQLETMQMNFKRWEEQTLFNK